MLAAVFLSRRKTTNMNWIKIEEELPPVNALVWVKRLPNKVEEEPIYLAMRGNQKLSTNPDASSNCYWHGIHKNGLFSEQERTDLFEFGSSFSDVTIKEWVLLECPSNSS